MKLSRVYVCSYCKTANQSNIEECDECYDLPNKTIREPYLSQTSLETMLEELIKKRPPTESEAAQAGMPAAGKHWQFIEGREKALKSLLDTLRGEK